MEAKRGIFTVDKPGILSLVQDGGRAAYLGQGIPAGGPMDVRSAQLANALVGNPPHHPVLEITLIGPRLLVKGEAQMALTGADLSPTLNGIPLLAYQNHLLQTGDVLAFGRPLIGCRAYLAIRGHWSIPSVFESQAAFPPALSHLLPESRLEKGQVWSVTAADFIAGKALSASLQPKFPSNWVIRMFPGPEFDQFCALEVGQFFSQVFTVKPASNRMGIRLDPPLSAFASQPEMISSGVIAGTLQLAHGGEVMVLMRDAQTTGGYPRFGQVFSEDVSLLGQAKAGDQIRFQLQRH
ncbi:MAG: biotin-dependent carboxyltransferase family protein [Bacteroidota bacterium]